MNLADVDGKRCHDWTRPYPDENVQADPGVYSMTAFKQGGHSMADGSANTLPHNNFQDMGELSCGDLVMAILKALRPLQPGDVMEVRALDPAAPIDIPAWCRLTGHTLVAGPCGPDKAHYFIQKKEVA